MPFPMPGPTDFSADEERQMREERRMGLEALADGLRQREQAMTPLPSDAGPIAREEYRARKQDTEDGELNGLADRLSLGKQT